MPSALKNEDASSLLAVSLTGRTWPLPIWDLTVGTHKRHGGLFDWRQDDALRYAGEEGVYTATLDGFQAQKGARYLLRVGLVPGSAWIRVNGQNAGSASIPPGDVDVTLYLHDGANLIEIVYRPSSRNAQIGLALGGNKSVAYLKRSKPLVPTGLIGPISLAEAAGMIGAR